MSVIVVPSALFGASLALMAYWWATRRESRLAPKRPIEGYAATFSRSTRLAAAMPWIALATGLSLRAIGVPGPWGLLGALGALLSYGLSLRESSRRRKWIEEIKAQWPLMLDAMATASTSGLDLRTAFQVAARRTTGALRQEMDKVSLRAAGGQSLGQALTVMEKDGIAAARRLRSMLVQAEVLGTPVSTVLSALSQEADDGERHELEQRFNALPMKLSIVTVVFLWPPVLIVAIVPHLLIFLRSQW